MLFIQRSVSWDIFLYSIFLHFYNVRPRYNIWILPEGVINQTKKHPHKKNKAFVGLGSWDNWIWTPWSMSPIFSNWFINFWKPATVPYFNWLGKNQVTVCDLFPQLIWTENQVTFNYEIILYNIKYWMTDVWMFYVLGDLDEVPVT